MFYVGNILILRKKMEPIKVFVGTDQSQKLAVKVLEWTIKKHTQAPVEVISMLDLDIPIPKKLENRARTGFSFYRFCIPALCNYKGKAIYMDADMQVFKDIQDLWNIDMGEAHVVLQEELPDSMAISNKIGSPGERRWKQCSVMLLNCNELKWDINKIIKDLDENKFTYDQLMKEMIILPENKVSYSLPAVWNSLEHFDKDTCNIHYTDMNTQPWVSPFNRLGYIWFKDVKAMLDEGSLQTTEVLREIDEGYFRPSLIQDVLSPQKRNTLIFWIRALYFWVSDKMKGYIAHKKVNSELNMRRQNNLPKW